MGTNDQAWMTGLAALATKMVIDMLTMAWPLRPSWVPPTLAMVLGVIFVMLQAIAASVPIVPEMAAGAVLMGVIIGGLAVGVTAMGTSAKETREVAWDDDMAKKKREQWEKDFPLSADQPEPKSGGQVQHDSVNPKYDYLFKGIPTSPARDAYEPPPHDQTSPPRDAYGQPSYGPGFRKATMGSVNPDVDAQLRRSEGDFG